MKPYFKYTIPELTVEPLEIEIWRKLPVDRLENQNELIEQLKGIDACKLTWQSLKLCRLPKEERDVCHILLIYHLSKLFLADIHNTARRLSIEKVRNDCSNEMFTESLERLSSSFLLSDCYFEL